MARLHQQHVDALVQPYVSSVDERGELALIFIDGEFSHAMIKGAMLNTAPQNRDVLFRREQMSRGDAPSDALAEGERALAACDGSSLLYARVDLLWTDEGWALLELELVEPSLFLSFAPDAATRLARAIANRLASSRPR